MIEIEKLATALSASPALQRRAALAGLSLVVRAGDRAITLRIDRTLTTTTGADPAAAFALVASPEAWAEFSRPIPAIGFQSLVGMHRMGHLRVEGDVVAYGRNLMFLEQLFLALRSAVPARAATSPRPVAIEPTIGRYVHVDLRGRAHRIYFEESGPAGGEGVPLVCLHTAGADSRQYRALMNDPEITSRFRVLAFDLPWHGKSSPPPGFENDVYRLTTDLYVDTVMAFCQALGLASPVVMGCSIGGRAVLHLALRHGDYFRAAIGLQSATHADPGADIARLRDRVLYWPDVQGQEAAAGWVACLIAPTSPEAEKWETLWHYMQGGPGVFLGDLFYYVADGDLRDSALHELDTGKCPLHLLTGEYDLSATPALTAELAKLVNATSFTVMEGLGHFPMSENPAQFRKYLLPILQQVLQS